MKKLPRRQARPLLKALEILLAVLALDLAFFLFRVGAAWWGR
jgi:hypothetical protein